MSELNQNQTIMNNTFPPIGGNILDTMAAAYYSSFMMKIMNNKMNF